MLVGGVYRNAIELDSKCTDAYFALADAYEAMGDLAQAVAVLEEGYVQTGSETMATRLEEIKEVIRQQEEEARLAEEARKTKEVRPTDVIEWNDPELEAAMRELTGIVDRDLTVDDVDGFVSLDFNDREIVNIEALSVMTNLKVLYLYNTEIRDISPLSSLTNLELLALSKTNVTDYSPVEFIETNGGELIRANE